MPDHIVDLYDRNAAAWARDRQRLGLEDAWIEQFRAGLDDGADILDIGCGHGVPVAQALIASGHAVTGIDASARLVALARQHFPSAVWVVGDMRTLQLHRRFDGIVLWHSLFHPTAQDQRAMFARLAGHARHGTMLLFTTGPRACIRYGEWLGEPLFHASLASDEYAKLLADNGFTVLAHQIDDGAAGGATVWLARFDPQMRPASGLDGSA